MPSDALSTVLIIGVGTLLLRVLPLFVTGKVTLSPILMKWMQQIPIAVVSALLFTELFWRGDHVDLSPKNLYLWAAIPTFVVGAKSRNLLLTVVSGIIFILIARQLSSSLMGMP